MKTVVTCQVLSLPVVSNILPNKETQGVQFFPPRASGQRYKIGSVCASVSVCYIVSWPATQNEKKVDAIVIEKLK